jgi:hypothetical protein
MYSLGDEPVLTGTGYPIRKSTGRGLFAALRGLSQLITSFFACWHQGIHHVLLVAFLLRYLKFVLCGNRASDSRAVPRRLSKLLCCINLLLYADVKEHVRGLTADGLRLFGFRTSDKIQKSFYTMGLIGLEPMTLRLSSACSNQLSYRPV